MAADPKYPGEQGYQQDRGLLYAVGDTAVTTPESFEPSLPREQMDQYFGLRERAKAEQVPNEATVACIQAEVDTLLRQRLTPDKLPYRLPDGGYDQDAVNRFGELTNYLRQYHSDRIPLTVLDASEAFIGMVTSMHAAYRRGEQIDPDAKGRFGFVVPARASQERPEDSVETIDPCPVLRYVPDDLRVAMYAGLPPFVVDRYVRDESGKYGYMLFAAMYPDMYSNLGRPEASRVIKRMANETVQFGRDYLGIRVFGLGAWVPGAVHFGEDITVENVITTTGHGGTIALILKTVRALQAREALADNATQRIGVLGLGSIGGSIAGVFRAVYPNAQLTVYDRTFDAAPDGSNPHARQNQRILDGLRSTGADGNVVAAASIQEVIAQSDIIVSAVTTPMDLNELDIEDLEGKVIVDDSQPWAFRRAQVEAAGGHIVWVAGEANASNIAQRESSWNYGGTLQPGSRFGCEVEADTLAKIITELEQDPELEHAIDRMTGEPVPSHVLAIDLVRELALRRAVEPEDALLFDALFSHYGVTVAPFQAEGKLTEFPNVRASRRGIESDSQVTQITHHKHSVAGMVRRTLRAAMSMNQIF